MRHFWTIFATLLTTACIIACDEGDIHEKEVGFAQGGYTVEVRCRLTGISQWGDGYGLVLAAFDNQDKDYDMGEFRISDDCEGKDTTLVWNNINSAASSVELCVTTRLRRRVITFLKEDLPEDGSTLKIDLGELNVGLYSGMEALFSYDRRCVGCHGDGNLGGLRLNAGNAYANLVGVPAHRAEFAGAARVEPSAPEASALHQMLDPHDDKGKGVTMFNHKAAYGSELNQASALEVIDFWIRSGAPQ